MADGDALTRQTIQTIVSGQDISIEITCYEADGTTLRDMTGDAYKLTFSIKSPDRQTSITKTSAASQIILGSPDDNSVTVILTDTDTSLFGAETYRWKLFGTDTDDDNQFVAAIGTMGVEIWP